MSLLVGGHLADRCGQVRTAGHLADTCFTFGPNSTSQTIRNIPKVVRAESCHSKFDQNNIMILKEKWEANANLMFIPKGPKCFDVLI